MRAWHPAAGALALLLAFSLAACSGGGNSAGGDSAGGGRGGSPAVTAGSGVAVELVPRTFYPRPEGENYWELVPLDTVGDHFLLHVHPRIRTPAEGPWTLSFAGPDGTVLSRHAGLHVDTATGQFTFLCRSADFAPGDWTIRMVLQEGGMTAGEKDRVFRFRVVPREGSS